jgi:hypothetical protein
MGVAIMKVKKTFSLTLIELMIAMGLALAVLSFALYIYRFTLQSEEKLKQEEAEVFKERILNGRLSALFSRLEKKVFRSVPEEGGLTQGESLLFAFFSEAYTPTYHGPVLARLFVDRENRLILAVWQYNVLAQPDTPSPPHFEVLAENVKSLTFEFLAGPSKGGIPPPGALVKEWKKEYGIPAAIKLTINQKPYAFPLPICGVSG